MVGADLIVGALRGAGVEVAFGLPGVHNLALWRALDGSGIRLVGVRHEQGAGYAADGYARAGGRVGLALVTTGPGAANTLAAAGEAWASRSPVVVIATDIPTTLRRPGVHRGVLHETIDQRAMFAPVTKATLRADDPSTLGSLTAEALRVAAEAPARPVFLEVPTDLLSASAPDSARDAAPPVAGADAAGPDAAAHAAGRARIEEAVRLLRRARRPLVWAGGGATAAGAGEWLARLAETLAAPVITTYSARGLLSPEHPCLVGLPPHLPEVGALWDEADLVIAVGSDLDGPMTQNWAQPAPPRLVAVNVDPHEAAKNYPADVVLGMDARAGLEALLEELGGGRSEEGRRDGVGAGRVEALAARLDALRAATWKRLRRDFPQETGFLGAFAAAVPGEATVVCDMCIPGYWLGAFHPVPAPRRLAYPMGWGTLGWALPGAIGAALAGPGPAVAVCGDGGFLFACGELATIAQERPPLTAVVVDDGGYGMLRYDFERTGAEPVGVDLATPDFAALARSFGVPAETVDGLGDDFGAALARHAADPAPSVLVARAALQPPPTTSPRWYRRS